MRASRWPFVFDSKGLMGKCSIRYSRGPRWNAVQVGICPCTTSRGKGICLFTATEAPDGWSPGCLMDLMPLYHHVVATRHQCQLELLLPAVSWHGLALLDLLLYSVPENWTSMPWASVSSELQAWPWLQGVIKTPSSLPGSGDTCL